MNEPNRSISSERKAMYYGGMALIATGLLVFVSGFFAGPSVHRPDAPKPGDPDFWERSQKQHDEFGQGMNAVMIRSLCGMGLMIVGGILMHIGARGTAGSGLVLNPRKAREDLEPWARMGGGMVQDALSEVEVARKLEEKLDQPPPQIKVRCRKCQALNDENARFCNQCGSAV